MITRPVGDIFEYRGKKYQVVEQVGCKGCDAPPKLCTAEVDLTGDCSRGVRDDRKSVVFRRVEG